MSAQVTVPAGGKTASEAVFVDVSRLVGYEIKMYTEQLPGKQLCCKVVSAQGQKISVESGGAFGVIGNLVSPQKVILQFPYKGQDIAVRAQLKRSCGGRCHFIIDQRMIPLTPRRYQRINQRLSVKLAAFAVAASVRRDLSSLRWIATHTVDVSGAGMMISMPSFLEKGIYLLIHIECEGVSFPPLLLARVCHCYQASPGQFLAGIEFIVREVGHKLFPPAKLSELPSSVLSYTGLCRERLNRELHLWNSGRKN